MSMFGYYHSSYSNNDSPTGFYIFGGIVAIVIIGWICGAISSHIEKRARELSDNKVATRKGEIDSYANQRKKEADEYQKQIREEADQYQKRVRKEADQHHKDTVYDIDRKQKFLDAARTQLDSGYIAGRRWLAQYIAEAEKARDNTTIAYLRSKSHPALSAAAHVKIANQDRREATEKIKFLEYQLASYIEYFPILAEYEDIILDEIAGFNRGNDIDDSDENIDRAFVYLKREEYRKLPPSERNQLALDAYKARNKSPWEIGRLYERYLGYLYEMDRWDVNFHGIHKGLEDLGRDLICTKKDEIQIVQAKCWSRDKVIHEKHVFQLYGTCVGYQLNEKRSVAAVFATTTLLSDVATIVAKQLNIKVWGQKLENDYPQIKCNINQGNRIYHLPFDQQYDRVKIRPGDGEFYALTVADAETKGFRRAKRHIPQASNA